MSAKRNPIVSIISPIRNNALTLHRALASVARQSYTEIEHIIIDGMSDDGCYDTILEYQRNSARNVHVVRERDKGMYDAINKGLILAQGEIIGILNGDDFYDTEAVEKVVLHWAKTKADVIFGNIISFQSDRSQATLIRGATRELKTRMSILHPATFIAKETYDKYGRYDNRFAIAADYELILRLHAHNVRMSHLDETLAHFRLGGMSSARLWCTAYETFLIQKKYVGTLSALAVFSRRMLEYTIIRPLGLLRRRLKSRTTGST